ncbi:hypothetical protein GCM10010912_64010 [Paenibacillus albidus]|uniref:Uncharacterized protein n=1 Tax=Paenibacillus albidus TaxID=2041023 RepID=A0A917FXA5_9BACL|nr:hypothetical protein GCM10010912_64010 [Paenibacillus albidus]
MHNSRPYSVVKTIVDCAILRGFLCGHDEAPFHDLSAADADRNSVIGEDSSIQQNKRTEIPLIVPSPLILGSNERYNGS